MVAHGRARLVVGGAFLLVGALLVAVVGGFASFCSIPPGCSDQGGSPRSAVIGFALTAICVVGLMAGAVHAFRRASRQARDL